VGRALVVALLTSLAALTACGGGGSKGASTDTSGDKAGAEKIVLEQSDFPSGWTAKPHQTSPDDAATKKRFFECVGASDPKPSETADAHSADFTHGQVDQASSEAFFLRTEAEAANSLAALQTGKTVDCIKTLIQEAAQKQLSAGTSANDVSAAQLKFPPLKDGTAAVRVSLTVETGGVNVPVYADVIYFKSGRAVVSLSTVNGGSPMDTKLEESLVHKMAGRS
jgi:hypothetical protein